MYVQLLISTKYVPIFLYVRYFVGAAVWSNKFLPRNQSCCQICVSLPGLIFFKVLLSNYPSCPSVWLVGRSIIFSFKGGKLHFHAHMGALVLDVWAYLESTSSLTASHPHILWPSRHTFSLVPQCHVFWAYIFSTNIFFLDARAFLLPIASLTPSLTFFFPPSHSHKISSHMKVTAAAVWSVLHFTCLTFTGCPINNNLHRMAHQ